MNNVLTGIRVLDVTNALAGSSATKLLADLGAEVIKVESPGGGDFTRNLMPYIFESHNRNKGSLAVNLKDPDGLALVKRLVATADVFVQSMRPGAARELGLSREELAEINPRLIYASFSAFGPSGPNAHRRGVDGVAQAESGLAAVQNRVLGNTSLVDAASGLALSQAILIALMKRDRLGVVEAVDLCLLDTAVYLQAAPLAEFSVTGTFIDQASYDIRYPMVGVYQAADGPFYMAPYWEQNWRAVCELIAVPELASDPRFCDKAARGRNAAELRALLQEALSQGPKARWTKAQWISNLEDLGVLAGDVRSYPEVLADPQLAANQSFEQHTMATGEVATFPRAPFRFGGHPLVSDRPAPVLGADTDRLLDELGIPADERSHLYESGAVGTSATLVER